MHVSSNSTVIQGYATMPFPSKLIFMVYLVSILQNIKINIFNTPTQFYTEACKGHVLRRKEECKKQYSRTGLDIQEEFFFFFFFSPEKQNWPRNKLRKFSKNYIDVRFYWRVFPHQFLTVILHEISHQTGKSDRITMNFTLAQYLLGLHFIRAKSDQKVAFFTKNESQSCFVLFHSGLTNRLDSPNCVDAWGKVLGILVLFLFPITRHENSNYYISLFLWGEYHLLNNAFTLLINNIKWVGENHTLHDL